MAKIYRRLSVISLFAFAAVALVSLFGVLGNVATAAATNPGDALVAAYALPAIHVVKLDATQTGSDISGSFTVKNSEAAAFGDLQYQLLLVGPAPKLTPGKVTFDNAPLFDHKVVTENFDIAAQGEKTVKFAYTVPGVAAGDYRLRVQIITAKGVRLGWKDFPFTLSSATNDSTSVALSLVGITVDGKAVNPAVLDGVNVAPAKEITLNYSANNTTGKEVTAVPTLGVWEFAQNRTKVGETKGEAVTLKKGANKLSFVVLTATKPEAYAAELTLNDQAGTKQVSNILSYRWVVTGASAEISSLRITKPAFNKGAVLSASVEAVGSADLTTEVKANIQVDVLDGDKVVASNKSDVVTLNSRPKNYDVNVGLEANVTNPTVRARIVDQKGTILDENSAQITGSPSKTTAPVANAVNNKTAAAPAPYLTILVILLAVVIIVILVLVIKGKKSNPTIIALLLVLSIAAVSFWALSHSTGVRAAYTCNPPLLTSGNQSMASPIDCSGYSFGTWTSHYECWQPNRTNATSKWCSGDALYPESRIFINNADLDNSMVKTVTGGKYLVPVEGYITTVACGNASNVNYSTTVHTSDSPTAVSTITSGSLDRGGSGSTASLINLGNFTYQAAFNAVRTVYNGNIVFNTKDIYCGTGAGAACEGEHEFTETFSVKINFPEPLSCTINPATVNYGGIVALSAKGGDADAGYRWVSDNAADTFSPATGTNVTLTPKKTGTTVIKVMNGQYLDVNGDGKVTMADYKLVSDCTNGTCASVTKTNAVGQNRTNPMDVNADSVVNAKDAIYFNTENTANYVIPTATCSPSLTVNAAEPKIEVLVDGTVVPATGDHTVTFNDTTVGSSVGPKTVSVRNVGGDGVEFKVSAPQPTHFVNTVTSATGTIAVNNTSEVAGVTFSPKSSSTNLYTNTVMVSYRTAGTNEAYLEFPVYFAGKGVKLAVAPTFDFWVVTAANPKATTATVTKGSSVTLGWSSPDADNCTASVDWTGQKAANGTATVSPIKTANTYTLYCTKDGVNSATKSVSVGISDSVSGTNIRDL